MYQREGPRQNDEAEQEPIHTMDRVFELPDRKGLPQYATFRPRSAPAAPNLEVGSRTRLSEQRRLTVEQGVRRECAKSSHEATQEAFKISHIDFSITGTFQIDEGVKNVSYRYVETILTAMAEKGSLDKAVDRTIERWAQSALFIDTFNCRALNAPRFTQSAANYIKLFMEKADKKWFVPTKAKALPPLKPSNS